MLRAAQISSGLATLVLLAIGLLYFLNPLGASSINGLNPAGETGVTNLRTLAAPLFAMALMAGIGTVKKNFVFIAPAALYFLFTAIIRIVGLAADGTTSQTLRGLVMALVLFALAEFAIFIFKREAAAADAVAQSTGASTSDTGDTPSPELQTA